MSAQYSVGLSVEGTLKAYTVRKGREIDPLATCRDRDAANNICDALNAFSNPSMPSVGPWTAVAAEMPEDGMEVLVCTKCGHVHVAVVEGGKWYPRDLNLGVVFSQRHITHWALILVPETEQRSASVPLAEKG